MIRDSGTTRPARRPRAVPASHRTPRFPSDAEERTLRMRPPPVATKRPPERAVERRRRLMRLRLRQTYQRHVGKGS